MSETLEGLERLVRLGGWGERSMSGLDLRLWPTYRTFTLRRCMGRVGARDGNRQWGKQTSDQLTQHGDWYPSGELGNSS